MQEFWKGGAHFVKSERGSPKGSPGSSIALGGGGGGRPPPPPPPPPPIAYEMPPPLPDDKDLQITCCVILKSPDYSVVRTNVNEAVEHDRAGAEWTRLSYCSLCFSRECVHVSDELVHLTCRLHPPPPPSFGI